MNGHCSTCDVEADCGYAYKPCDCCNYRKFKSKVEDQPTATGGFTPDANLKEALHDTAINIKDS